MRADEIRCFVGDQDLNTLSLRALHAELTRGGLARRLYALAREEDLGAAGDVTSAVCFGGQGGEVEARLVMRGGGVVCGMACAGELAGVIAPGARVEVLVEDGTRVERGTVAAVVRGGVGEVLALERTLLNLVGRLSGVATATSAAVGLVPDGCRARVFDTRKTTPGLRVLEKYAVRCGGGMCHRIGLFDAVLIKDNHLAAAGVGTDGVSGLVGFVREASARARRISGVRFVEVEVDTMAQYRALLELEAGVVDIVLLDNFDVKALRDAVALREARRPGLLLEASGGITRETLGDVALTGVDRISMGSITHSAVSLDVALDLGTIGEKSA